MKKHAFLSASGAPYWMMCEAKPWREKDVEDIPSIYAQEGTAAHTLLEHYVKRGDVKGLDEVEQELEFQHNGIIDNVKSTLEVVRKYKDEVVKNENKECVVFSEQTLDISFITGEKNSTSTADIVLFSPSEIVILDLKYGKGVKVEAKDNMQLLMYAAAAVKEFDVVGDIDKITMVIHQPRRKHVDSWTISRVELWTLVGELQSKAWRILAAKGGDDLRATPGKKQCHFCKVKNTCPERNAFYKPKAIAEDFPDLTKENEEFVEALMGLTK